MQRFAPALAALALVASACVSRDPGATYGNGSPLPSPGSSGSRTPSPASGGKASSAPPITSSNGGGTHPTSSAPPTYRDDGGVGENARAYLAASPARALVVEVDYVEGRAPASSTLTHLEVLLDDVAQKPGGVDVRRGNQIPLDRSTYSFADIARLEQRHRSTHSEGSSASLWLVWLNGSLQGEAGTLGVAYKASAAAVFPDEIKRAATALVQSSAIERSVATHETGHLLGLINLVRQSSTDHEDPSHPKHSKYKDSVMYWAVEDVSITAILGGGPPDDFDAYDRQDLAALARA